MRYVALVRLVLRMRRRLGLMLRADFAYPVSTYVDLRQLSQSRDGSADPPGLVGLLSVL